MIYRSAFIAAALRGGRTWVSFCRKEVVWMVALLVLLAGVAQGQYLGPRVDYAGGNQPLGNPVIRDVSGDGILDVVVGNSYGNSLASGTSVYLGLGGGVFGPRTDYASAMPRYVEVADVNGDGVVDIVTDDFFGSGLSVLLGAGNGTFGLPTYYSWSAGANYCSGLVVADVTGDGRADLVYVVRRQPYQLVVLPGIVGGFGTPSYSAVLGAGVALVDVNADGNKDLITAGISVALGLGGGRFGLPSIYPATGFPLIGDVNGDGRMDFVMVDRAARTGAFLLGQVGGGFSAPVVYPLGLPAAITFSNSNMVLGDVTADGRADLLITDPDSDSFVVIPTLSGGGFGPYILRSTGMNRSATEAIGVATADLNGDGRADVVTANYNSISVYLNQSTPTATFAPAGSALSALTLSPNPAHATCTLTDLPATAVPLPATLCNALGQVVRTLSLASPNGQAELSVAGLPTGVYALHMQMAGQQVVRRLVVE